MTIQTKRLTLRHWQETDAHELYQLASSAHVGPIAGWPVHPNEAHSLKVIQTILSASECYAICLREQDKPIGAIELMLSGANERLTQPDECELGYWLGYPYWHQGFATEAAQAMIEHGFVDLGMKAIWCGYYEQNERSKHVQEKCGFIRHHVIEHCFVPALGVYRRCILNLLTKERWLMCHD